MALSANVWPPVALRLLMAIAERTCDGNATRYEPSAWLRQPPTSRNRSPWPERFNHDELSAIQHAMNLKLQDEAAFFAEYQNEPLDDMRHPRYRAIRPVVRAILQGVPHEVLADNEQLWIRKKT